MRHDDVLFTGGTALFLSYCPSPSDHGKLLNDGDKKEYILRKVKQLTGSTVKNVFPISQPESFRRSTINSIVNGKYCAALKTDGIRAMLLMTKYGEEYIAVFIDRKMEVREVEVWAPEKYFEDTLYDGEIVAETYGDSRQDVFLAFDMYVNQGVSMLLDDYTSRITTMNTTILDSTDSNNIEQDILETDKIYMPPAIGVCIRPKRIMKSSDTKYLWELRMNMPHLNDGVIFTPDTTVLTTKVYKWKPLHTIDILLYRNSRIPHIMQSRLLVGEPSFTIDKKLYTLYEVRKTAITETYFSKTANKSVICECTCDIDQNTGNVSLAPIKIRDDKTHPNAYYVVKETINNILECVSINEFETKRVKR